MEFKRFALAMVGHFLASLLYVLRRLRLINAVVDTSSILEHREEIRDLWEKRMMADDNQSSPSSITIETKPALEEGKEEAVASTIEQSEMKTDEEKLPNGSAKTIDAEDTSPNPIPQQETKKNEEDHHATLQTAEADQDNNNCADSLEEDNIEDYIEEKTYTSETSLVMKSEPVQEEVKTEEVVQTTTVEEGVSEVPKKEMVEDKIPISEEIAHDSIGGISSVEETVVSHTSSVEQVSTSEVSEEVISNESKTSENIENDAVVVPKVEDDHHEEQPKESLDNKAIKSPALEIPDCTDEDGFVRIEECLPIGDNIEDIHDVLSESTEREVFGDEHKNGLVNGHDDHPSSPSLPPTPDSALGDKLSPLNPPQEMEHFVKSGGLKRVPVNKTEQPYSSCTTETKIAMEIREMREREEELRIMRERAPLTSPVPPKSPLPKEQQVSSPTPPKDQTPSPVPNGCGYRVSSVFGHKGATSPSPSVEEPLGKGTLGSALGKSFTKESQVEKEIRIARDREEELRRQKGLPPREDDSYVKPSQVKSSQVRVFGPVVGANNMKQAATAKIQLEIEEQTQREMALRDTGSIQTISQERTDAKVAKLKAAEVEVIKTATTNGQNGTNGTHTNGTNGTHTNGQSSPDVAPYKRGTPSPINVSRPASIFSQNNGPKSNGGISMHKFISSKGKEATFTHAPVMKNGSAGKEERGGVGVMPPNMVKLKRTVSVESKIQQEIMEMKQREEELKLLHMNRSNDNLLNDEDMENEMNQNNSFVEYGNGNGVHDEDLSPRHNKLIAQWEQRIQKAES